MSRDVAIVDLDGTIFSRNSIDVGHLNSIRATYGELIIVSNNSSVSHLFIESFLSSFTSNVLTPQLLGRALFQDPSVLTRSCCQRSKIRPIGVGFGFSGVTTEDIANSLFASVLQAARYPGRPAA